VSSFWPRLAVGTGNGRREKGTRHVVEGCVIDAKTGGGRDRRRGEEKGRVPPLLLRVVFLFLRTDGKGNAGVEWS
jgi:hypothetical protein